MVISTTNVAPKLRASSLRIEDWNNIVKMTVAEQRFADLFYLFLIGQILNYEL